MANAGGGGRNAQREEVKMREMAIKEYSETSAADAADRDEEPIYRRKQAHESRPHDRRLSQDKF